MQRSGAQKAASRDKTEQRGPRPAKAAAPLVGSDSLELIDEIQQLRQELRTLRNLSYLDALTELRNGRYFDDRMQEEAFHAQRDPSYSFSVAVIDVDGLRRINDTCGRSVGDDVLRQFAAHLKRSTRRYDVCCRIGEDEFGILLPGADATTCGQVSQRLGDKLDVMTPKGTQSINVSIGVATWDQHKPAMREFLRRAYEAMLGLKREHEGDSQAAPLSDRDKDAKRLRIRFDGLANPVSVTGTRTESGLRLQTRLPFLRVGSSVCLLVGDDAESAWATVRSVTLIAEGDHGVPHLEVELVPWQAKGSGD